MASRVSSDQTLALGIEHLSSLLNSTQELLAVVHPDGNFLFVNDRFSQLVGYPSEQLIGASIFSFLHPGEESAFRSHLHASRPTSPSSAPQPDRKTRCRLHAKDGSWRWF